MKKDKNKSKAYSKENRRRKKQYVKEFEIKVERLESEIKRINYQFWKTKSGSIALSSGLKPIATKMHSIEKGLRKRYRESKESLSNELQKEDVVKQLYEIIPRGKARIKQLKYHFKAIMDTVLWNSEKLNVFL